MLGRGRGGGVPGVWDDWVAGRGYTGTPPSHPPGPHIEHIPEISPTHGQMKAKSDCFMRFPIKGPERVQKGSRNDLKLTLQTTLQTGPEMALR